MSDLVKIQIGDTVFDIEKQLALKSQTLMTMMDNDKDETIFTLNELKPEFFQMAIDYLNDPNRVKEWNDELMPELLKTANYLDIESLLTNVLRRLCAIMPFKSSKEIHVLFQKIPDSFLIALLHCTKPNVPKIWPKRKEILQSRDKFISNCQLKMDYVAIHLDTILNPNQNCIKYLKSTNLYHVMPSKLTIRYDNPESFANSAKIIKEMKFNIRVDGICNQLSIMTQVSEVESIFSMIEWPEYMNALLYCVNENVSQDWSLRDYALLKRNELHGECNLKLDYQLFINNADSKCLQYIQKNQIHLIVGPLFSLDYDNLEFLQENVELLNNVDLEISLTLSDTIQLPFLFQILKQLPQITHLNLNLRQPLDLLLFPEMPQLKSLTIHGCQLLHLLSFLTKDFPRLTFLDLSSNQIEKIGKLESLPQLEFLILANNQLKDVSELTQISLPNIVSISLDENKIKKIGRIHHMPKLQILLLSDNRIYNIDAFRKSVLPELTKLSLTGNQLQIFGKTEFMPKLKEIHLDKNVLHDPHGILTALIHSLLTIVTSLPGIRDPVAQDPLMDIANSDPVTFQIVDKESMVEFIIDKNVAKQSQYLMNLMEEGQAKDENKFQLMDLTPDKFQLAMDYLENPKRAKQEWKREELPSVVFAAHYLEIDQMLKDSLPQLCRDVSHKSAEELISIFSMIPESLVTTLLHCANDNTEFWPLKGDATYKKHQLRTKCQLGHHFDISNLETMVNAKTDCLKYLKKNQLNLIMAKKLIIHYDNAQDLEASVFLVKDMGLQLNLNGICGKLLSQSIHDLKSLFSKITMLEHKNALLHCVVDPPYNWALRNEALEKRKTFQNKCNLEEEKYRLSVFFIHNANPDCLNYMKENKLNLVTAQRFVLEYDDLKTFQLSADILKELEYQTYLFLTGNIQVSLLVDALTEMPYVTNMRILKLDRTLDLSLLPDMPSLKRLIINECSLSHVSEFLKKDFPELRTLDLSQNQLDTIEQIQFMPKLQFLNLGRNHLQNVSQLLESNLPALKTLNLNYNKIKTVQRIDGMRKLRAIEMFKNQITDVSQFLQSELPELEELNIIYNSVRIPKVVASMPKLVRITQ